MKARMKTIISGAVLGLTLLAKTVPSWAGATSVREVMVGGTWAIGSVASARYSADGRQEIGCSTGNLAAPPNINCYASDKNGNHRVCLSDNPNFLPLIEAITDYSEIYFSATSAGVCNTISINNSSDHLR